MSLIQVRVDDQLKKDADMLFKNLGLDTTTAIRIFLKQAISKSAIPFKIALNDEDTVEYMSHFNEYEEDIKAYREGRLKTISHEELKQRVKEW